MIPTFIGSSEGVAVAAARIAARSPSGGRLGVDTEFHAERRYVPELMLVQVATPDGAVWVFDALGADLTPLRPVLAERDWVVHGGQADLALLDAVLGVRPRGVWDVQVLAGLLGHGYPRRLEELVREVLAEEAPAGATLTDWSRRPLSEAQLAYAAADAALALRLADALRARAAPERLRWWRAAGAELVDRALAPPNPNRSWLRLEIAPLLTDAVRARLHALCAWREEQARLRDQPPGYVVPDGVLLDVARRCPGSVRALAENRRLSKGVLKRHGETLLALAHAAQPGEGPPQPPAGARLRAQLLGAWAIAHERAAGLAAALVLPAEARSAVSIRGVSGLEGWRREAIGPALDDFLNGVIVLGPEGLRPAASGADAPESE